MHSRLSICWSGFEPPAYCMKDIGVIIGGCLIAACFISAMAILIYEVYKIEKKYKDTDS